MRTLAQETGGRAFFPAQDRGPRPASTRRSPTSSPASTRSATRRRTRAATAPGAASSCRWRGRTSRRAPRGATTPRQRVEPAPPRPLRRRRRRLRDPLRAARSRRSAAPPPRCCCSRRLAHTFVIGMQTMEVRHVPFANPSRAISTFVWLLALSYLYLEITTDERAMGVFILPIVVGLQTIPVLYPGVENRDPVLDSPWFWVHVVVAALRLRQLRAGRRARPDLHAAVQGDQEEAPRLLLHAAAVAADARRR